MPLRKEMSPNPAIYHLQNWLPSSAEPLIIAGPCSAESEDQLLRTARQLANIPQVKVFRAGLWKPRTRPDGFEGVGVEGLKWMQRVKEETGLMLTTEVANPMHVEQAVAHGIDILWIGARTVVNPFSVQELAEVLRGHDIPVLVKNPLTPDIKLWMGALERFNHVGITKLGAVHRGFHYYKQSPYRNAPMWEIAIELKRLVPALPVITDISHITGRRDLLQSVAQKALDLETNGLMIESHYNPHIALTDAAQQIAPDDLQLLINNLVIREKTGSNDFQFKLEELRSEIDKLDGEIMQLLAKRMDVVSQIGEYKKQNNITILQLKRWQHIIEDRLAIGTGMGLDRKFLLMLLELVHEASIQKQTQIFNAAKED